MPGTDYQTLNNPYLFHAWNRLSYTKQPIFISCLVQTIRHLTTHTYVMPGKDYQPLNNPYLSHAWNRLSYTKHPHINLMPGTDYETLSNPY